MAERDREPFEDLYRDHRGAVYRFLRRDLGRAEAEDVTQTAFAQAYTAYLRGTRPERPRAWLLTIAENLRRRRFRSRRVAGEALPLEEELVPGRDRVDHLELREALETLPLNQRAALVLREVAGLSYDEIARSLRLSVGSVQMLLFRARRSMREELATARRGLTLLPPWLTNLIPGTERFATPLRVAGAAVAVSTAVVVASADPAGAPARSTPTEVAQPAVAERTPTTATPGGRERADTANVPIRGRGATPSPRTVDQPARPALPVPAPTSPLAGPARAPLPEVPTSTEPVVVPAVRPPQPPTLPPVPVEPPALPVPVAPPALPVPVEPPALPVPVEPPALPVPVEPPTLPVPVPPPLNEIEGALVPQPDTTS